MKKHIEALSDYRQPPTLGAAAEQFLTVRDLSANTVVAYRQPLNALAADLGAGLRVDELHPELVLAVFGNRWGDSKANTWNTHRNGIQAFVTWCQKREWLDLDPLTLIEKRRHRPDETKAIHYDDLDALMTRRNVQLREKTLCRFLYETSARAGEVLALNLDDLHLRRHAATNVGKGGKTQRIEWADKSAGLLGRYLRGRKEGPLFLTHRSPTLAPARRDLCPVTGRTRLSYHRAAVLFKSPPEGGHSTNCAIRH